MRELVEFLATALVDIPDEVKVWSKGTNDDVIFCLSVAKNDLGKVIGKKGRTAKAMRTLLAAAGAKRNKRFSLEIIEPDKNRNLKRNPIERSRMNQEKETETEQIIPQKKEEK